jgi:hypothetical protein
MKKLFGMAILCAVVFLGGYHIGQHMERLNLVKAGYGEFNKGRFSLKSPAVILADQAKEEILKKVNEISETE